MIPVDAFANAAFDFSVQNQDKSRSGNDKIWNVYKPPAVTMTTLAETSQVSEHSDPCVINHEFFNKLYSLVSDEKKERNYSDHKTRLYTDNRKYRPPLQYSMESTDLDVSFSSDFSVPGFPNSSRTSDELSDNQIARKSRPDWASRSLKAQSRVNSLRSTRVVPSIEITHETSSEEDAAKSAQRNKNLHLNGVNSSISSKIDNREKPRKLHEEENSVSSSQSSSVTESSRGRQQKAGNGYCHNQEQFKPTKSASAANIIQPPSPSSIARKNASYLSSASEHGGKGFAGSQVRKSIVRNSARRSHSVNSNRSQGII